MLAGLVVLALIGFVGYHTKPTEASFETYYKQSFIAGEKRKSKKGGWFGGMIDNLLSTGSFSSMPPLVFYDLGFCQLVSVKTEGRRNVYSANSMFFGIFGVWIPLQVCQTEASVGKAMSDDKELIIDQIRQDAIDLKANSQCIHALWIYGLFSNCR